MTLLISGTAGSASAYRNAFRQPSSPEGLPNVVGVVWVVLSAMFCGLVEHAATTKAMPASAKNLRRPTTMAP